MSSEGVSLHFSIKAELHTLHFFATPKISIPRQPSMSKIEGLRIVL